jgi:hypothetical protein
VLVVGLGGCASLAGLTGGAGPVDAGESDGAADTSAADSSAFDAQVVDTSAGANETSGPPPHWHPASGPPSSL